VSAQECGSEVSHFSSPSTTLRCSQLEAVANSCVISGYVGSNVMGFVKDKQLEVEESSHGPVLNSTPTMLEAANSNCKEKSGQVSQLGPPAFK
jgi:hypothetical protein